MSPVPDILCIGSVLWDIIGRTSSHMHVGSDVPGRISRLPGGVALNIAMALKAYEMTPAVLSAIGRDEAGRELLEACARLGVITTHAYLSDDLPTDQYMAVEGANGLVAAIADAHSLEAAGQKVIAPLLTGALKGWKGLIALDGNLTPELLAEIAAHPAFAQTDLRVAPASPGKAERITPFLTHPSTTLYVNLEEAGLILHSHFEHSAEAARALVSRGLRRALVTAGAAPATLASHEDRITLSPPEVLVTRITGAGDTFMAAHIAAEAAGQSAEAALGSALEAAATYISGETYG